MKAATARLWLRWSWRDLRRRWLLVTALALVIALGTGAYAGLGGTTAWRLASNDASYAALRMHDLRVRLPEGGFVGSGALVSAARGIESADAVAAAEERLVVPTQVDASHGGRTVLVPGEIVGMSPEAAVDTLFLEAGRALVRADDGTPTALLESKFAAEYSLPDQGSLRLSGGERLGYVGTGYSPEYFQVTGRSGQILGGTGYAVLFVPLTTAQQVTGHPAQVNDLVVRLVPGADPDQVQAELAGAVAPLGGTVTNRDDDPVYRGLYADARNDQTTWNMFAVLILLGAAFAAFNLISRMVDAQRRELGVGMALGLSPRVLALRPLLVGTQIAVVGVSAGIGVGWLMGEAMRRQLDILLPLPIWLTPFQTGRFVEAAALGLAIPVAATVLPLRRALRMQPVDAIRVGAYGGAHPGGFGRLVQRIRLPGRSYVSMPLRNVVRAGRRTVLTALGVAAAITSLVAVLGLLDSFVLTGERNTAEVERMSPDRLAVTLDTFYPKDSRVVRDVVGTAGVGEVSTALRLPLELSSQQGRIDALVEVLDLDNPVWTPSIVDGDPATAADGILLSEKAAADLGVAPGDTVTARHPVVTAQGLQMSTSRIEVSGVHPNPMRAFSYLDTSQAAIFGLGGSMTNLLTVVPASGTSQDALVRAMFERPGVVALEPASGFGKMLDDELGAFTGILRIIEAATLLLALLIAFNTASLTADERARENATMFAFGLPPRVVLGMSVAENAVTGALGTLAGIGAGFLALRYIIAGFDTVAPDLSVEATLSPASVATTLVLGVLVVALAPLLGARRLRRMDIPATLRVVE